MRETNLLPLTAHDQIEFLDWDARRVPFARKVTSVLVRFGDISEPEAAKLTVGEREALLLRLRRATFGERIACTLACPRPECREKMDLNLTVEDLLTPRNGEIAPIHEASYDGYRVRFRLPDGADQEAVASLAQADDYQAVEVLLKRCIIEVERDGSHPEKIPPAITDRISDAMAALDPQAEIVLEPLCPACGNSFRTILDAGSFFFSEVTAHARALLREVHVLASFYHWNEAAILAIPERRRKFYLDLAEAAQGRRAPA